MRNGSETAVDGDCEESLIEDVVETPTGVILVVVVVSGGNTAVDPTPSKQELSLLSRLLS